MDNKKCPECSSGDLTLVDKNGRVPITQNLYQKEVFNTQGVQEPTYHCEKCGNYILENELV